MRRRRRRRNAGIFSRGMRRRTHDENKGSRNRNERAGSGGSKKERSSSGGYGRRRGMRLFNTVVWTASVVMVLNMLPADSSLAVKLNEYAESVPALSLDFKELTSPPGTADADKSDTASDKTDTDTDENQTETNVDAADIPAISTEQTAASDSENGSGIQMVLTSVKTDVVKNVETETPAQPTADIEMVKSGSEAKLSDATGSGTILIYHTHATEAYQPVSAVSTHTTDLAGTVREGANTLSAALSAKGYNVIHDTTLHDSPSYNKSYTRSLETAKGLIADYPEAKLMVDYHRDAASASSGKAKTAVINGEKVASFCLVVGTQNTNYSALRSFADKITAKANEMYPGFATAIVEKPYKFNEYLTNGYILLEVGNNANTIDQVNAAAPYLSDVLTNVLG